MRRCSPNGSTRRALPRHPPLEAVPAGRIPAPFSNAVGRERDLATLLAWLSEDAQRLVTLVGPGGIGKSRLAIEVARNAGERFDRVTFVSLAQVRDPDELLGAIARELGVRDTGDAPLSEQLGIARAGRRDLIVLDNFEQIVDAAPDVVSLLTDLPGATFLVTSRVRLRVRGRDRSSTSNHSACRRSPRRLRPGRSSTPPPCSCSAIARGPRTPGSR